MPAPRRQATTAQSSPQTAKETHEAEPALTADQKADLFRQFDQYLASPPAAR